MHLQPYDKTRSDRIVHKSNASGCRVKSAIASDVVAAVTHALRTYVDDFEVKIENSPDIDENDIQKQIDALVKEMRKIEKKKSKLFDSWENDDITNNEFVERKAIHNQRLETLEKQIEDLEYTIPEKEEYEEKLILVSEALMTIQDDQLDAATKNESLKQIISRIDFSRENDVEFILDIDLHQ